ncbi:hypothetical protein SeMB42_g06056 [Synchytrium endobioticum]|uniref:Uncharacterized protein n=1 Tax=Synchytrium endobioticum TaxID=286115 RepID=A0A507CL09_9FUNG|nr:hypothetical protein SeMB42_g06056 [Synchytrium endobioticum]
MNLALFTYTPEMLLEAFLDNVPYLSRLLPLAPPHANPPDHIDIILDAMECEFKVIVRHKDRESLVNMQFDSPPHLHQDPPTLSRMPFHLVASNYHLLLVLLPYNDTCLVYVLDPTRAAFMPSCPSHSNPYIHFPYLHLAIHNTTTVQNEIDRDCLANLDATFTLDGKVYGAALPHVKVQEDDLSTFTTQMDTSKELLLSLSTKIGIWLPHKRNMLLKHLIDVKRTLEAGVVSARNGRVRKLLNRKRTATAASVLSFSQEYEKIRNTLDMVDQVDSIQKDMKELHALEIMASTNP